MTKQNSMLTGKPIKSIIKFSLPIMASSLLQYNYTLVDNILVGRYVSTDALAAVGGVASINSFIVGAALGLTSGFTIPVAHAYGAKDQDRVNRYSGSSITVSFLLGLLLVVVAHIISTPLLKLIGTPDEILGLSSAYVNILYFAIPFQMLSNNFTAISRACLLYTSDAADDKAFRWSVEGAALATLISHITAAVLTGNYILRRNTSVHISKKELKLDLKTAFIQLKLGIPVSLQFTVTSIGSMCLQSAVNSFGTATIAGFTAAGRVENIANIPLSGLSVGTQTFVGQNYGAGKYDRIIKSVKKIFTLNILLSVALSVALLTAGMPIVRLFMTEPNEDVLFAAHKYLIATAECFSLVAVLFVLRNTLQGLGFTYANAVAGAGELIGRISIALIFTPLIGFNAVCYAAPAAWLLADIPLAIIYLKKKKKFKALAMRNMNTTADI